MNLVFQHDWALYLLPPAALVCAAWFMAIARRSRQMTRFLSPLMFARLVPRHTAWRDYAQAGFLSAAIFLGIFAAARPRWGVRQETVYTRGRDLLILLDVSRSMLAEDVRPNRLERVKTDLLDLVRVLDGDRAGLVAFRNSAEILCPLTTDYSFLRQAIAGARPESAKPGETNIGRALRFGLDVFDAMSPSHKALLLVSDGEDMTGDAEAAAREAGERGIPVFAVGFGSDAGQAIPDAEHATGYLHFRGEQVMTRRDDSTLEAIAAASGGAYVIIGTASTARMTLGDVYRNYLLKLAGREIEDTTLTQAVDRFQLFLLPAVLCAIAAFGLSRGRLSTPARAEPPLRTPGELPTSPPGAKRRALALACALLSSAGSADAGADPAAEKPAPALPADRSDSAEATVAPVPAPAPPAVSPRSGRALFAEGDYAAAAKAYERAASLAPRSLQDDYLYNAAVSAYLAGKFDDTLRLAERLTLEDGYRSRPEPYRLKGAALWERSQELQSKESQPDVTDAQLAEIAESRVKFYEEAGQAFQAALRLDPGHEATRSHLAHIQKRLPALRREAIVRRVDAMHGNRDPAAILHDLFSTQESIQRDLYAAVTNETPERVALIEELGPRQLENSHILSSPRILQRIAEAAAGKTVSNAPPAQPEAVLGALQQTHKAMETSARNLRSMSPDSYRTSLAAQRSLYDLWKAMAPPEALVAEDLRQQTNLINVVSGTHEFSPATLGAMQDEARSLTELFTQRFESDIVPRFTTPPVGAEGDPAAPPEPPAAMAPTNALEIIAEIRDLAHEVHRIQGTDADALRAGAIEEARPRMKLTAKALERVIELLNQLQQSQRSASEQQAESDAQPDESENQDAQNQPDAADTQPEQTPSPNEEERQQQAEEDSEPDDEQLERLLQQALDREAEYERILQQRNRVAPSPLERDW